MKITEIKVAFIKSNRSVKKDDSNTKSKMKSIEDKGILMPVTWVTVERALQEGLEVVDKDDKEVTEGDYKVIIDGQHRIMAAISLNEKLEGGYTKDIPMQEYTEDLPIMKWLSEVNIQSVPWKGTDFVSGAASVKSDDEVVKFAMELKAKGFKVTQISWILTFTEKNITKDDFVDIMNGRTVDWKSKGVNIDTAKAYLEAMKDMDKKMNYSGMFKVINTVCSNYDLTKSDVFELISSLSDGIVKSINGKTNKEAAEHFKKCLDVEAENKKSEKKKSEKSEQ